MEEGGGGGWRVEVAASGVVWVSLPSSEQWEVDSSGCYSQQGVLKCADSWFGQLGRSKASLQDFRFIHIQVGLLMYR